MTTPEGKQFLKYSDLEAMGLGCRHTIARLVKAGRFPKPYRAVPRRGSPWRFDADEVRAHVEANRHEAD